MSLCLIVLFAAVANAQTVVDLLDPSLLHEIRLTVAPADWQSIKTNYLADTSYPVTFAWNGYTVTQVGLKSRGSQSRSPIKPSLGLDFSKYLKTQRFAGLKTLVLRNLNQDASMLHEFLAEALFARLGLPYSREAFAKLYVNAEYVGLYLMVEPIDARFLQTRFADETGSLYDLQDITYRFEYLGPDPALYVPTLFDPKTDNVDPAGLVELIRLINQAPAEELSQYFDVNDVLLHAAAETALANWDGLIGKNGIRNFYLYRRSGSRQAMLLGWDMDAAFTDYYWPLFDNMDNNVLTRRLLAIPANRRRFLEALDEAAHAIADGDWLANEVERLYPLIQQAVYTDPYKLCRVGAGIGPCTNAMFDLAAIYVRQFASTRAPVIWSRIAAEFAHDPDAPDLRPSAAFPASPGSIAILKTPLTVTGPFRATSLPLPQELAGVSVQTEAGPAQLFEVCPESVTFLLPGTLACGPQAIQIHHNGHSSNTIHIDVRPAAPQVLGAVRIEEWIVAYTTGLGNTPASQITLLVNGQPAAIHWVGPVPGLIGMQQINAVTTATAPFVLQIRIDNEPGPTFKLPETR